MNKYDFTQNDKCLGTFHVGCEADEHTPNPDPNGSCGLVPGLLALALPALTAATYSMLRI